MPRNSRILGEAFDQYQDIRQSDFCTNNTFSKSPLAGFTLVRLLAAPLCRKWRLAKQDARQCAADIKRFVTFARVSVVRSAKIAFPSKWPALANNSVA